jgi:D-3-phosphoglycerate dehydrogenase
MTLILLPEPRPLCDSARRELERWATLQQGPLTRAELLAALPAADVLWVRFAHRIDRELIAAGTSLRAIVSPTTGLDHIDLEAARRAGVPVLSLRGERELLDGVRATAEHTIAILLGLLRRLPAAVASTRAGEWEREPFQGREIARRTVGVLGYGRNGRLVTRTLQALDAHVLTHDPDAEAVAAATQDGVETVGFDELLERSAILTVHVPLEPATAGLLGARELALLPEGAVLVNTSRGEVVDEDALVAALESGRLAGAALDVIADEARGLAERPLSRYAAAHDDLLLTPHIGGWTLESVERTEVFLARRVQNELAPRA